MMWKAAMDLAERGWIPQPLLRLGIRSLLHQRLAELGSGNPEEGCRKEAEFLASMASAPIALVPEKANQQHYELPAVFFAHVLGPRQKYSCCYWGAGVEDLATAEEAALQQTCEHGELEDGLSVLDLGCGWGSLSLWIAERYPRCRVLAVSNSRSQTEWIRSQATSRGLQNVRTCHADMNTFDAEERFDRIFSVEMFEHMRNWPALLHNVSRWLAPGGRFLLHVFVHRLVSYPYTPSGPTDWMSEHFFTGGMMPSDSLPLRFQDDLRLLQQWRWNGTHYQRTCQAWLRNYEARRTHIWPILQAVYGSEAARWWMRWKLFFLGCAELFGFRQGSEWWVSHYLFAPRQQQR